MIGNRSSIGKRYLDASNPRFPLARFYTSHPCAVLWIFQKTLAIVTRSWNSVVWTSTTGKISRHLSPTRATSQRCFVCTESNDRSGAVSSIRVREHVRGKLISMNRNWIVSIATQTKNHGHWRKVFTRNSILRYSFVDIETIRNDYLCDSDSTNDNENKQ